ncbi:MAG: TonB-dependent receptor plug domain-containing protein, partial [Bacteroidota bacterium]
CNHNKHLFMFHTFRLVSLAIALLAPFLMLAQDERSQPSPLPIFLNDSSLNTSASVQIEAQSLNQGLIHNPIELIQGKVAGLMIARPGSEPNALPDIRLRGYTGLGGSNPDPIYVVDGVPNVDISTIDPADVQKITVIKDAASAAIYGLQGGNGIILIETMRPDTQTFRLSYRARTAIEQRIAGNPVATAAQFVEAGGVDLGSETDWFDAISRDAFSHSHHLRLDRNTKKGQMYASANIRQAQGLLKDNQFDQYNFRLGLVQSFWQDRITTGGNLVLSRRITQHADPHIIRHATTYNPTAPIRSDAPEFDPYGGFFEQNLFDTYNPVAILEQQEIHTRNMHLNGNLHFLIDATPYLQFKLMGSRQASTILSSTIVQKENRRASSPTGFTNRVGFKYVRNWGQASTRIHYALGDWRLNWRLGVSMERLNIEKQFLSIIELLSDDFDLNTLIAPQANRANATFATTLFSHQLQSGWSQLGVSFKDQLSLQASLRRDKTSTLIPQNATAIYPAFSVAYNFAPIFSLAQISSFKLRGGWGKTGNLLGQEGLTQSYFWNETNFSRGRYFPAFQVPLPSFSLEQEQLSELNLGFDILLRPLDFSVSLDVFFQDIDRTYWSTGVSPSPGNLPYFVYQGPSQSRSGLELALQAKLIKRENFSWQIGLNSTLSLREMIGNTADGEPFNRNVAPAGSPNANTQSVLLHQTGQAVGSFNGYLIDAVRFDSAFSYIDLNQDGRLNEADQVFLGNSLPRAFYGLSNQFNWKNWSLNFLIESYLGHSIANMNRFFYETNDISTLSTNWIPSPYFETRVEAGKLLSDYFLEEADFVRLRHLSLSRTIKFKQSHLNISLMAQNLLTLTDYTGANPEVRLQDLQTGDPSASGIDRRSTYPLGRAFILGIDFQL